VTLKSDVFAFAVTMWEMASRMHPWHGLGVMAVCAFPDGVWWLCAVFAEKINGLCAPSRCIRTRLPACISLQGRPHALCCQTRTHKHILTRAYTLLAQVATKVVVQNARLPVAPVEQVRRRMVAGHRALRYSNFVQG
jgi:hypothetical protein